MSSTVLASTTRHPHQPCLTLTQGHLPFGPDHHHDHSSRPFSNNSLPNMQHYTDDLYPLEPFYAHQHPQSHPPQTQTYSHYTPPAAVDYVSVQRQMPSTRTYAFQPYPTHSPRISHYSAASSPTVMTPTSWDADFALLDYPSVAYGSMGSSLCNEGSFASHGLYNPSAYLASPYPSYGVYQQQQQQQQQPQQPTCIAPEDLFARLPMTPISPASLDDADDRASSPSSSATTSTSGNDTPLSTRSSPTARLGLQIPTVPSLTLATSSIAPSWTTSSSTASSSNSTLPSPVDSLSSQDDEPAFIPTPSLKKSAAATSVKSKRATRSAAPEPAWVEAVLAEDAKRLQVDIGLATSPTSSRPANRPIAFACVFCRHRKIQCIRPKTEVAPGEKPAPCNQCEKRNRCCEYPPAALNPRVGRRTRPAGPGKTEE